MASPIDSSKKKPRINVHRTPESRELRQYSTNTRDQQRVVAGSHTPQRHNQEDLFDRKQVPIFEKYWSKDDVSSGLERRELVQGVLRINVKDFNEGYVSDPENGPDWFLPGLLERNRAMDGDVVVLKPYPPELWTPYKDESGRNILESVGAPDQKLEKPTFDTNEDMGVVSTPLSCSTKRVESSSAEPLRETLIDKLCSAPASVGGSESRKLLMAQGRDLHKIRRTGKVVGISKIGHNRTCAGRIKIFNRARGLAFLSPFDSRIPRVVVPLSSCPEDLPKDFKKYETTMFVCRIECWPEDSPFARGEIFRSLGEAGDIEPESQRILLEQGIVDSDFSPVALSCLPSEDEDWKIPPEEERKRRDFRKDCVFSIDPSTARDLDDALHCTELSPGVFEVGVHIADVSYFVEAGTALDREAADRATSVYLVQRVISMLPRKLCEDLCSLNPNEDRLSFSVVWKLTDKGELLDQWIGRSLIRSVAKLSYDHAQMMIDDPTHPWKREDFPTIVDEKMVPHVVKSVNTLNKLAKWLRSLRKHKGSLQLNQDKLAFTLDSETGLPNGCHIYEHKESNNLIEEFMLLANMAVAHYISNAYPELALLRRHPPPKDRSIDNLKSLCANMGISLDTRDSATLQASLHKFDSDQTKLGLDKETVAMQKKVVVNNCVMVMELARYFCTGSIDSVERYHHYALNVPRYTHFTSPIRRYADLLVHRLLASSLAEGPSFKMLPEEVQEQAEHCNKMKRSAKIAGDLSSQLFLAIFLRECGPWIGTGMVTAVLNRAIDVLIFQFGIVKRIYCEQLPLKDFKYEPGEKGSLLTLVWKDEFITGRYRQVQNIKVFSVVQVSLCCSNKSTLQLQATVVPTIQEEKRIHKL